MGKYEKPLPVISEEARPFWDACKKHELLVQHCQDCGQYQLPMRAVCKRCWSTRLENVKASGEGIIYSITTVCHSPSPEFDMDVPYDIALVELDEGPRIMSNLIQGTPGKATIGERVEVVFQDATEDVSLPKFRVLRKKVGKAEA